jgi:hypothetical protein
LSALGKDADFLYDDIIKYIRDAEIANESEVVELWETIRNDHQITLFIPEFIFQ